MECHDCHRTGFTGEELEEHGNLVPACLPIAGQALRNHVKYDECETGMLLAPEEDPRVKVLEDRMSELERVYKLALASGNIQAPAGELEGGHDEPPALPPPKNGKKGAKA